jgi:hypothetical protein
MRQVLAHSVPSLSHYRPEAARRAVLPDLAALVWSGVNHLVWPPLAHASLGYAPTAAVHIVYMHQVRALGCWMQLCCWRFGSATGTKWAPCLVPSR